MARVSILSTLMMLLNNRVSLKARKWSTALLCFVSILKEDETGLHYHSSGP